MVTGFNVGDRFIDVKEQIVVDWFLVVDFHFSFVVIKDQSACGTSVSANDKMKENAEEKM